MICPAHSCRAHFVNHHSPSSAPVFIGISALKVKGEGKNEVNTQQQKVVLPGVYRHYVYAPFRGNLLPWKEQEIAPKGH